MYIVLLVTYFMYIPEYLYLIGDIINYNTFYTEDLQNLINLIKFILHMFLIL